MISDEEWRANGVGVMVKEPGTGKYRVTFDPEGLKAWIRAIQTDTLESAIRECYGMEKWENSAADQIRKLIPKVQK